MAPKSKKAKTADAEKKPEEETVKDADLKEEEKTEDMAMKSEEVKAEETKADDGETKEEATEEAKEEAKEETPQEPEKPVEKPEETDAPEDKRPKVKPGSVRLNLSDATLNVMSALDGKLLLPLSGGGMQYLWAGVRSNAGIKSGRYLIEAKIVEVLHPAEANHGQGPRNRHMMRFGVCAEDHSTLLDREPSSVYFDLDGQFWNGSRRLRDAVRFSKDHVMGIVINVDAETPNANTVSLFRDGKRISQPHPLPEALVGKTLYPCITYKNVGLEVNFGPASKVEMPFTCRMLGDAAAADVEVSAPKDGKREVIFPVGLPDQGVFDWLDGFLEKNPHYVELSDRKVLDWANQSQLQRARGPRLSNDKPGMNFGIPSLDDLSVQKTLAALAPTLDRDFVRMELKSNLLAAERKNALNSFPASQFKRVAVVALGEPPEEMRLKAQEQILAERRQVAEKEKEKRAQEKAQREAAEARLAKAREAKELREAARKRKAEEMEEKKEEEKDEAKDEAADSSEKKEGDDEKMEDTEKAVESEKKETEAAEEEKSAEKAEEAADEKKDEKMEEEKAKEEEEDKPIELTEEEKKQIWFIRHDVRDLNKNALAKSFAHFNLPSKDEGFDEIRYVWQPEAKAAEYMKAWILDKKKNSRAEDLEPSQWFKDRNAEFATARDEWRKKHREAKIARERKERAAKMDQKNDEKKKEEAEKKKAEEEKKKAEEEKKDEAMDGDEEKKEDEEETKEAAAEKAEEGEEGAKAEDEEPFDDEPDVDKVEDINDIGNGSPLYENFTADDWVLLDLRFQLHLLAHAFKHDLDDADRPGFTEKDLNYYYNKYYKKTISISWFGVKDLKELCKLMEDTLQVGEETGFLESKLSIEEPVNKFIRFTEECRRARHRCIEAGDETASLNFSIPDERASKGGGKGGKREDGGHRGKGGDKGRDRGSDRPSRAPAQMRGRSPPRGQTMRMDPRRDPRDSRDHRGMDRGAPMGKGYGRPGMPPPAGAYRSAYGAPPQGHPGAYGAPAYGRAPFSAYPAPAGRDAGPYGMRGRR